MIHLIHFIGSILALMGAYNAVIFKNKSSLETLLGLIAFGAGVTLILI